MKLDNPDMPLHVLIVGDVESVQAVESGFEEHPELGSLFTIEPVYLAPPKMLTGPEIAAKLASAETKQQLTAVTESLKNADLVVVVEPAPPTAYAIAHLAIGGGKLAWRYYPTDGKTPYVTGFFQGLTSGTQLFEAIPAFSRKLTENLKRRGLKAEPESDLDARAEAEEKEAEPDDAADMTNL